MSVAPPALSARYAIVAHLITSAITTPLYGRLSDVQVLDDSSFLTRLHPALAQPFLDGVSAAPGVMFVVGAVVMVGLVAAVGLPDHRLADHRSAGS